MAIFVGVKEKTKTPVVEQPIQIYVDHGAYGLPVFRVYNPNTGADDSFGCINQSGEFVPLFASVRTGLSLGPDGLINIGTYLKRL